MKICSRCKTEKPYSEYYVDPRYTDGYQGVCSLCQCVQQRSREHTEQRKLTYKKYRASEKGKKARRAEQKRYMERYPYKVLAQSIAGSARKRGLLIQEPCEVCGESKVEGHHDDYSKPLNVRWLCKKHHDQHHKE